MDIAQYIADLLKEKKEVSIPGLGSFYVNWQSASFNKESNAFFPPKKELSFKTEESDPSLLISRIAEIKNISEPSAKYFAESFGSEIKKQLDTGGRADLKPLGILEAASGKWTFKPSEEFTFSDYYGLSPIQELQLTVQPNQSSLKVDTVPFLAVSDQPEEEAPAENQLLTDTGPNTNEAVPLEEVQSRKRKTWPVVLIIIGILAGGGITAYISNPALLDYLLKPNTSAPVNKQVIPVAQQESLDDSVAKADSIMQELHTQGFYDVTKIPDTVITNVDVTAKTNTNRALSSLRIEIIGASLPSRKEAENYIRQMKARGIDARIVEEKKGRLIKVSLGSFTDRDKADAELQRIRREITKEAWPLTIKN